VTPWVLAARDAGARVQYVGIHRDDCTLDLDDLRSKLTRRTRLVAVGCASNSVGTRNPVREICHWAREAGALSFLDGVHFAPHDLLDVAEFGCDFLACSATNSVGLTSACYGAGGKSWNRCQPTKCAQLRTSCGQVDDGNTEPRGDRRDPGRGELPGGSGT